MSAATALTTRAQETLGLPRPVSHICSVATGAAVALMQRGTTARSVIIKTAGRREGVGVRADRSRPGCCGRPAAPPRRSAEDPAAPGNASLHAERAVHPAVPPGIFANRAVASAE
jgi:hypothetical protein